MNSYAAAAALAALLCVCGLRAAHAQDAPTPPPDVEQAAPVEQPPAAAEEQPAPSDGAEPRPEPPKPSAAASPWSKLQLGVGAVIHLDGSRLREDQGASFGSPSSTDADDAFVRRAVLLVGGQILDWRFRLEPDFAPEPATGESDFSFQDLYAAHRLGPGEIRIGQRRPFRGMEDLTSSNDTLMMERPFASSAGVFNGGQSREFALGAFYQGHEDDMSYGLGAYSLRAIATPGAEGIGLSARTTFTPWKTAGRIVHLGGSASYEDPANDQANVGTAVSYAGVRGPVATLGLTGAARPAWTLGLEGAATLGPVFVQAEFMSQYLEQASGDPAQLVLAYYLQGSVFVTGETKPYNPREGVFRSPAPRRGSGALELTARYDEAGNRDAAEIPGGCGGSALASRCVARALTVGANYSFAPGVRLMVNFILGEQDRGVAGTDAPEAVTARLQVAL